jgi:RNA methyltransferase, TrmH family
VAHSTLPSEYATATKAEVRRLRALLRDRKARAAEGVFVCEGPRVIASALDHDAELLECFVDVDASADAREIAARCAAAGIPVKVLNDRVGDTRTPQGVLALGPLVRRGVEALAAADLVVVAAELGDPGNAGTLFRSAAAAGAQAVVLGPGSVDAYNPKVVRASAGACFAIRIVEAVPTLEVLEALGAVGARRLGAVAHGGELPESYDMRAPTVFVLGHETRGLTSDVPLDGLVTIPIQAGESLNVAMAGTALLYEAARQRRSDT